MSSKRSIGQLITEMPKTREKIGKLLPISKERAREIYDELVKQHGKLLEDISSCRLCLSEMELDQESALAAGLYYAVKGFSLMTPDYIIKRHRNSRTRQHLKKRSGKGNFAISV